MPSASKGVICRNTQFLGNALSLTDETINHHSACQLRGIGIANSKGRLFPGSAWRQSRSQAGVVASDHVSVAMGTVRVSPRGARDEKAKKFKTSGHGREHSYIASLYTE